MNDPACLPRTDVPSYLPVVSTAAYGCIPIVRWNTYSNTLGTLDYAAGTFSDYPSGTLELLDIQFEAIAATTSTSLTVHFQQPRMTDVTYGGNSMLAGHRGGHVEVYAERMIYLPLIMRDS